MTYDPLLIGLPVADRVRAHDFYRDGLGLDRRPRKVLDKATRHDLFTTRQRTPRSYEEVA
jgi:hypothetical protein